MYGTPTSMRKCLLPHKKVSLHLNEIVFVNVVPIFVMLAQKCVTVSKQFVQLNPIN